MRKGLTFVKRYAFQNAMLSPSFSFSQSQPLSFLPQSFGQLHGLSIARESLKKRKPIDARGSLPKRSRSNSQSPDKAKQENEVAYTVKHSQTTSLYIHDESSFDNRIFSCLVTSPAGRGDLWFSVNLRAAEGPLRRSQGPQVCVYSWKIIAQGYLREQHYNNRI